MTSLEDIPYEVLTGTLLPLLDSRGTSCPVINKVDTDILSLSATCRFLNTVAQDQAFWRIRTLQTFRLPPQPIRQKGWDDLYKRLSTAKVFTWGINEFGRLGHSYDPSPQGRVYKAHVRSPTEIEMLRNEIVVDLKMGGWSGWALTAAGKVYGWGKVQVSGARLMIA